MTHKWERCQYRLIESRLHHLVQLGVFDDDGNMTLKCSWCGKTAVRPIASMVSCDERSGLIRLAG